jgi:hypothetical protein
MNFFRYFIREDAERALNLLNNTYLDNRIIRIDIDTGFIEGRQYGRGWSGAQKRDELCNKYDPDRPVENNNSKVLFLKSSLLDKKYYGHKKRYRDHKDN